MIGILNLRRGFAAKFIKFKADLGAADGLTAQRRADAAIDFKILLPLSYVAARDG